MLFTRKFIRQNLEISIYLRPLDQTEQQACDPAVLHPAGLLVLKQTVKYGSKNISDQAASHTFSPREYALIPHSAFPQPFKSYTVSCGTYSKSYNAQADFKGIVSQPDNGIWHDLSTPPVEVPSGKSVDVVSVVELVCRDTDIKTWLTYYPAESLKLKVEVHNDLIDQLEFAVDKSHRAKLEPDNDPQFDKRRLYGWKLEFPILPHQGIILYWRRKPVPKGPSATS